MTSDRLHAVDDVDAPGGDELGGDEFAEYGYDDGFGSSGGGDGRGHGSVDRRRRRRVWIAILVLVAFPLAVIGGGGLWFTWQLDPPGAPGEEVHVKVEKGWGVGDIGNELADQGVVSSAFVFSTYARVKSAGPFQAGEYTLQRHMGVRPAIAALEDGPQIDYSKLAAPPGWWLEQIAARVGKLPGMSSQRFLEFADNGSVRSKFQPKGRQNLEGLLWPDTYNISESEDELAILSQMVKQFDQHGTKLQLDAKAAAQGVTPYQAIVIASLIQGEARVDSDRPLIASVIYNRLRAQPAMPLQIDATLLYGSGDPQKRTITRTDLDTPGPYNTYLSTGLPPTPIASITESSLRAALNPAQTDYLYYVLSDEQGHHAFSQSYEEFLQNKQTAKDKGLF